MSAFIESLLIDCENPIVEMNINMNMIANSFIGIDLVTYLIYYNIFIY